jgi:hypothetical protein
VLLGRGAASRDVSRRFETTLWIYLSLYKTTTLRPNDKNKIPIDAVTSHKNGKLSTPLLKLTGSCDAVKFSRR